MILGPQRHYVNLQIPADYPQSKRAGAQCPDPMESSADLLRGCYVLFDLLNLTRLVAFDVYL